MKTESIKIKYLLLIMFAIPLVYLSATQYMLDDAVITYRYCSNLVNGHGLVPYIGGPPVEGYSNPTLLFATSFLAILSQLHDLQSIMRIGLYINIIAFLLCCCLLVKWGEKDWSWISGFLFLTFYPTHIFLHSGLETCLYTLFFTLAVYGFATRKNVIGLVGALLTALSRPEGIGLSIFLSLIFLFRSKSTLKRNIILTLCVLIIPFGLFLFWRYAYFGQVVSMTSIAKTHATDRSVFELAGLKYIFLAHKASPFLFIATLLSIYKCFKYFSKNIFEFTAIAFQILFIIGVGGDDVYFDHHRFIIPMLPLLFRSFSLVPEHFAKSRQKSIAVLVILIGTFTPACKRFSWEMETPWVHKLYHEINTVDPVDNLNALNNPRPAYDEFLSYYLSDRVANSGAGLSLSSVQGGSLLLHWNGEYQDESGLMTKEYAVVPRAKKEGIFCQKQPDLYISFSSLLDMEELETSIFPAISFTVNTDTLENLGYRPNLLFFTQFPPIADQGKLVQDKRAYVFTIYTKDLSLININTYSYLARVAFNEKIYPVPAIIVKVPA